jgi:hypothetical protein
MELVNERLTRNLINADSNRYISVPHYACASDVIHLRVEIMLEAPQLTASEYRRTLCDETFLLVWKSIGYTISHHYMPITA